MTDRGQDRTAAARRIERHFWLVLAVALIGLVATVLLYAGPY